MTFRVLVYASIAAIAAAPFAADAQTPSYQGALPAKIAAPRKVASTPDGDLFVANSAGSLYRLTKKGEVVGKVLDGVVSVASGPGTVFAGTKGGDVVQINPRTGRVVRRFSLGVAEAPAALAYDAAAGNVWIAYESGLLEARAADGAPVHRLPPAGGVYRLVGLAVDGGLVWVAQDRTGTGATLHRFDAVTGAPVVSTPVSGVKMIGGMSARAGGGLAVTDLYAGNVTILSAAAASVGTVGSYGTAPGQLKSPAGVAVAANGDSVVANLETNRLERFGNGAALGSCPGDSDCDGLPDDWELANGLDPNDPSDGFADADRDGLNAAEEYALGTNPRIADTDGDGYSDAAEVASGFDPRNPNDHKPQVLVDAPTSSDPGLVRLSATVRDPVGDRGACSLQWKQVSGAPVALKGAATPSASFVARAAGSYRFEAAGACGGVAGVPARVDLAINNVAPRADGGRLVTLAPGDRLDLSAQFSSDANGDPLTFSWDQLLGPSVAGTGTGKALSATVSQPGYYVFRVGAVDKSGVEGAAEVPVLVLADSGAPTAIVSTPVVARAGETVTLDASGSYRGDAAVFSWQQVDGPAAALQPGEGGVATVVLPQPGRYAFEVSLSEGGLRSPPARVDVFASAADGVLPTAQAAAPASAATGVPVTLDGTGSAGESGLAYAWRQVSGPAAGLTRADRAAATVVLFERGTYEFELVVTDLAGASLPARVRVDARDRTAPPPVAVATAASTASVGDLVVLDGRASAGAMRHRWTQVDGPWVTVTQGAVGSFVPKAPGVYAFELEVDDGAVRSAPARVIVAVF